MRSPSVVTPPTCVTSGPPCLRGRPGDRNVTAQWQVQRGHGMQGLWSRAVALGPGDGHVCDGPRGRRDGPRGVVSGGWQLLPALTSRLLHVRWRRGPWACSRVSAHGRPRWAPGTPGPVGEPPGLLNWLIEALIRQNLTMRLEHGRPAAAPAAPAPGPHSSPEGGSAGWGTGRPVFTSLHPSRAPPASATGAIRSASAPGRGAGAGAAWGQAEAMRASGAIKPGLGVQA